MCSARYRLNCVQGAAQHAHSCSAAAAPTHHALCQHLEAVHELGKLHARAAFHLRLVGQHTRNTHVKVCKACATLRG